MNEKIIFRRNPAFGVLYIVMMAIFCFNGFISLALHRTIIGAALIIAALIIFFVVVWLFRTPFAVIEKDHITVNMAPLNKQTAYLPYVKRVHRISKNKVDLYLENGREVALNLGGIAVKEKEKFVEMLERLVP